jgi:septal ring factor EnvC (AmiA/AmiB activator)
MKLSAHNIVSKYEESIIRKEDAEADIANIDADILSVESCIKRKQLELDSLITKRTNTVNAIAHHSNIISKLISHYGEAKSAVQRIIRLKKEINKVEQTQERRRKVLKHFYTN